MVLSFTFVNGSQLVKSLIFKLVRLHDLKQKSVLPPICPGTGQEGWHKSIRRKTCSV